MIHRWPIVLGLLVAVVACGGSAAEARARSCFEALSLGNVDAATQCVAADRRERLSEGVKQRAAQMKGCHTQVSGAQVREQGDRAEVLLKFKEPCGEPPRDANGRKVTGMGVGLVKQDGTYYVTEYERSMQ